MINIILSIIVMLAIIFGCGFIWFILHMVRIKGWKATWDTMMKVGKDKLWHFIGCNLLATILITCKIQMKWTFIIVMGIGILKELYDRFKGEERKFDNGDLLADLLGTIIGII